MESTAPMNIPTKSWIKDSSSSLGSSPSSLDFNPPGCPNCQTAPPPPALPPSTPPSAPAPASRGWQSWAPQQGGREQALGAMSGTQWPDTSDSSKQILNWMSIFVIFLWIYNTYSTIFKDFLSKNKLQNTQICQLPILESVLSHKYWVYIVNAAAPTEGQDDKQTHPGKTFPSKDERNICTELERNMHKTWEKYGQNLREIWTTNKQKLTSEGDGARSWDSEFNI